MSSQKKILIITHGIPHPHRGASRVLFYWYIHAFKKAGYAIIHLVLDTPHAGADQELQDYLQIIGADADFRVIYEVLPVTHRFSYKKLAMEPALPNAETILNVRHLAPDATVCFDIVAAAVAKKMGLANLLIWLGDLTFQTGLYHAVYDIRTDPLKLFRLPRAVLNSAVWKRFYQSNLCGEKNVVVASKSSEKLIDRLGAHSKYLAYPWPGAEPERQAKNKFEQPTFILFGTLAALGSKSAFHLLLKKIYPLLVKSWGETGFKILIAGTLELPDWVKEDINSRPALQFMGFVDDLAALVDQCHAVLAPISVPVGNRSRIVTAMSMGSIVIAHKNTALGNPELVSGENCYLGKSAKEFVGYMRRAYENPDEASRIGQAAHATYLRAFEPRLASERLVKLLASILAGANPDQGRL